MNFARRYYLLCFFYIFVVSLTKTTFIPYLRIAGLSPYEVHLVLAVFAICAMVFEVPTAAIGEWLGPKNSFVIGCACKCIAAALFFSGTSLPQFYAAEVISALAIAFISGSLDAWLMNRMNDGESPQPQNSSAIFMMGDRLSAVALALGGTIGAYMGYWNLSYPWIVVGIGFATIVAMATVLLAGQECKPGWKKDKVYQRWQWHTLFTGYRLAILNPILLIIVFSSFLASFALASPKVYWLNHVREYFQLDMRAVGLVWFCIGLTQFLGSFGISALLKLTGSPLRLKLVFSVFSMLMLFGIIVFQTQILGLVIFYLLLECGKPYHTALNLTLIHSETKNKGRITILSLDSLASKFGNTLGLLAIGWISTFYNISLGWALGLAIYMLVLPCYVYLVWKEFKNSQLEYCPESVKS